LERCLRLLGETAVYMNVVANGARRTRDQKEGSIRSREVVSIARREDQQRTMASRDPRVDLGPRGADDSGDARWSDGWAAFRCDSPVSHIRERLVPNETIPMERARWSCVVVKGYGNLQTREGELLRSAAVGPVPLRTGIRSGSRSRSLL
jgi:hypothetical protein